MPVNKMPTIYDIAKEAGVSYSTVSRTLSGFEFVKESTREKVLAAANKLGYVPNQQARSLAGGPSNLIGVLVPTLANDYITQIIHGIDDELTKSSYNLILYTTNRHQGKEATYAAAIMNGAADALLLVAPLISDPYLDVLREQNFPYVLIDQADQSDQSTAVNTNNQKGAYEATQYLIQLGHRRIGFIAGLPQLNSAIERLAGYKKALADYGLSFHETYVAQGRFTSSYGYTAAKQLLNLATPPTAIFAANDLSAMAAMEAIREHGLRIPDDISLVGFDDVPQASIGYPKLTTIRQPLHQMGQDGARLILERLANPSVEVRRITLETELIIRDSCAPPRA
ncbi:MAG: LacI family DNA-binding transcriptional regulator [Chloroflexi bacterium]|nr:LacI family DNA-binding transcriptional regulator [Chloroflexota bacterium]